MKIISIIDDTVFEYFKTYGVGSPTYVGNWADVLPTNLSDRLELFDWNKLPIRNFSSINPLAVDHPLYNDLIDLSHFSHYKTIDHCQWRIVSLTDFELDLTALNNKIEETFTHYKIWVTRIDPGCCIPQHLDSTNDFVDKFQIDPINFKHIKRVMILPHDVQPWHHLWYGNEIISKGTRGDTWSLNFWEPHGGSNLGPIPKYTLQVMGI